MANRKRWRRVGYAPLYIHCVMPRACSLQPLRAGRLVCIAMVFARAEDADAFAAVLGGTPVDGRASNAIRDGGPQLPEPVH